MPTIERMANIFRNERKAVEFLIDQGVVDVIDNCALCGSTVSWHQKWPVDENAAMPYNCFVRRCRSSLCRKGVSIFKGTILEGLCHPKNEFVYFVYLWLCGDTTLSISTKLGWTPESVRQWDLYLREVCMLSVQREQEMNRIGGPGVEVQIDESKFGKRKYNRGKRIQGTWVFGGVEILYHDNGRAYAGRCFAVAVPDRTRATLLPLLRQFVEPGSHISSDDWRAYWAIEDMTSSRGQQMYTHDIVVHEHNFKDPITGTHTNVIEGQWRWMKRAVPHRFYYDGDKVQTCLYKYMWDRMAGTSRWETFISELRRFRYD
jgi:hypothetical protein